MGRSPKWRKQGRRDWNDPARNLERLAEPIVKGAEENSLRRPATSAGGPIRRDVLRQVHKALDAASLAAAGGSGEFGGELEEAGFYDLPEEEVGVFLEEIGAAFLKCALEALRRAGHEQRTGR